MREETSDTHVTGRVRVARLDDAIVVTMPGTSYSITYRKVDSAPSSSPQVSETISTLQSAGIRFALEPRLPQTRRRAILGGLSSVGFGRCPFFTGRGFLLNVTPASDTAQLWPCEALAASRNAS